MDAPTKSAAPVPETTAVTVLLTNGQTAMLDEIAVAIRRKSGAAISRSAMIRAFLTALLPHRDWWITAKSEASLHEAASLLLNLVITEQQFVKSQSLHR